MPAHQSFNSQSIGLGRRKKFEEIEFEEINNRIFMKATQRRALKIRDNEKNAAMGPSNKLTSI